MGEGALHLKQFAAEHNCHEEDAWFCCEGRTAPEGEERLRQAREAEEQLQ
jgi:hypothetical protein